MYAVQQPQCIFAKCWADWLCHRDLRKQLFGRYKRREKTPSPERYASEILSEIEKVFSLSYRTSKHLLFLLHSIYFFCLLSECKLSTQEMPHLSAFGDYWRRLSLQAYPVPWAGLLHHIICHCCHVLSALPSPVFLPTAQAHAAGLFPFAFKFRQVPCSSLQG